LFLENVIFDRGLDATLLLGLRWQCVMNSAHGAGIDAKKGNKTGAAGIKSLVQHCVRAVVAVL
jgi:hypothetical protein